MIRKVLNEIGMMMMAYSALAVCRLIDRGGSDK